MTTDHRIEIIMQMLSVIQDVAIKSDPHKIINILLQCAFANKNHDSLNNIAQECIESLLSIGMTNYAEVMRHEWYRGNKL